MRLYIFLIISVSSCFTLFCQKRPQKIKSDEIYVAQHQVFSNDSTPLNGYYKIKYVGFLGRNEVEVSRFKNGYRYGSSKVMRSNTVLREGDYVNGRKHGTWKNYETDITSEYKNGLKHGKEFGKRMMGGKFICTYENDSLHGTKIKYGYFGDIESKESYHKGKKLYEHKFDDFLNIIEKRTFTYVNDTLTIEERMTEKKDIRSIDSIYFHKERPVRSRFYKNNKLLHEREICITKDTTRSGKYDKIFTLNFYDKERTKQSISFYYNEQLVSFSSIKDISKYIISDHLVSDIDSFFQSMLFSYPFEKIHIYIYQNNVFSQYRCFFDNQNISSDCSNKYQTPTYFKQSY